MRYVLHPGIIASKADGDFHWISFVKLADLYQLPVKACINFAKRDALFGIDPAECVHLRPCYDGKYLEERSRQEEAFYKSRIPPRRLLLK